MLNMKEINEKIQVLYNDVMAKLTEVNDIKKTLGEERINLTEKIAATETRAKDITNRENAVRGIEDVQALSNATAELQKEIKEADHKLVVERTAFENYQAQFKKESAELTANLNGSIEANKIEKERFTGITKERVTH